MNSFTFVSPTFEAIGIAVDPLISVANHSCDPNCIIMCDGPSVFIRTLKPMKTGEEITISYGQTSLPFWKRQQDLKAKYYFYCRCSKCTLGPTLPCDRFLQPLDAFDAEKWRKVLKDELGVTKLIPNRYKDLGEGPAADVLTTLENALFDYRQIISKAEGHKHIHENAVKAMKICKDSGMWPVYREPYETFRESDRDVSIGRDDLVTACAHAAVSYCDVLPVMYPQRFHPLRLVGTWTLLCLINSITPQDFAKILSLEAAQGLDLGTVSYTLAHEVIENVGLSHGNECRFFGVATGYAKEVLEGLREANPIMFEMAPKISEHQMTLLKRLGAYVDY